MLLFHSHHRRLDRANSKGNSGNPVPVIRAMPNTAIAIHNKEA